MCIYSRKVRVYDPIAVSQLRHKKNHLLSVLCASAVNLIFKNAQIS